MIFFYLKKQRHVSSLYLSLSLSPLSKKKNQSIRWKMDKFDNLYLSLSRPHVPWPLSFPLPLSPYRSHHQHLSSSSFIIVPTNLSHPLIAFLSFLPFCHKILNQFECSISPKKNDKRTIVVVGGGGILLLYKNSLLHPTQPNQGHLPNISPILFARSPLFQMIYICIMCNGSFFDYSFSLSIYLFTPFSFFSCIYHSLFLKNRSKTSVISILYSLSNKGSSLRWMFSNCFSLLLQFVPVFNGLYLNSCSKNDLTLSFCLPFIAPPSILFKKWALSQDSDGSDEDDDDDDLPPPPTSTLSVFHESCIYSKCISKKRARSWYNKIDQKSASINQFPFHHLSAVQF